MRARVEKVTVLGWNKSIGVFEHLETTYPTEADQRIAYTQRILRGAALKKIEGGPDGVQAVGKGSRGRQVDPQRFEALSTDRFCNWYKSDRLGNNGYACLGLDKCVDFEKDLWFELGKCMWRKHRNVFQDHLKYI